jgi:peptidoglycan-associated lipoprotein
MKIKLLKIVPVLALSLLFAGCDSMPGMGESGGDQGAQGAEVTEAGAETSGAQEGTEWAGSQLGDPNSPLYEKVIYFDYDASTIRAEYQDLVTAHGHYLAANPEVTVSVEGHCDERGSREYNIALGERRANTVRDLLIAQGASPRQIVTVSFGEERPADPGTGEAAWAKNRRVELVYKNAR